MGPHSSAHGGSSHTGSQSVGSHAPIHAGTAQAALASHWGAGGHAPLGGHPFHPHGKAPLLDASERVGVARARFESDPESAVRLLEELRGEFAPSPHVLHALCLMRAHAGQPEQAVALAREALPLCFQRGHLVFAAEIIRALWAQVDHLGIGREHSLVVASTLRKAGDLQTSCKLYKRVLGNDRAEPRAIKGLMNSADTMIEDPAQIDEALRIYEFLLMTCKTSRLVEDMRRGHEEAVRRKARVHDLEPAHAGR
jgi:hypothetical protein